MPETAPPAADPPVPLGLAWRAGYTSLGPRFVTQLRPTPVPQPTLVAQTGALAARLGLPPDRLAQPDAVDVLAGNRVAAGSTPWAGVYSGHQFGQWAGQLGDGRAITLGEAVDASGAGWELQLKGAGRTPYSRGGDGRAVLRSSIREFLCSEAMHGLGIPTTRALALVATPLPVRREAMETGAVVTRMAPSFLRFGHFEHFAARGDEDALRTLADWVIARFHPAVPDAAARFGGNVYAALLEAVALRTAALVAQWQAVGFCHGVLNTDNMSVLGLTLDYGPFQFLDAFDPHHVCNHSDTGGRYAYDQQPQVCNWNLFCLAQALLPLIGDEGHALAALGVYQERFQPLWLAQMRAKLGVADAGAGDLALVESLLGLLAAARADWTLFWRRLADYVATGDAAPLHELVADGAALDAWLLHYSERLPQAGRGLAADSMRKANPKFVLRNHLAEVAIARARLGDYSEIHTLARLLAAPFDDHPGFESYAALPPDWAQGIAISCSS